jgi:hypothetical protein
MDNILTFIAPLPEGFNKDTFLYAQLMECEILTGDIPNVLDFTPDSWDKTLVAHHYPIETMLGEMIMTGEFGMPRDPMEIFRESGVTHIAILEGPVVPPGTKPWQFDGAEIKGVAIMVYWCDGRKTYRFLHCDSCTKTYIKWLGIMQEQWDVDGKKLQGSHTVN